MTNEYINEIDVQGSVVPEEDGSFTIELYIRESDGTLVCEPFIEKGFLDRNVALKYLEKYGNQAIKQIREQLIANDHKIISEERIV